MYLVDANIFLEVLPSRARKDECEDFLKSLGDGRESGVVTDFTVHSIVVIMDGLSKLSELRTSLLSPLGYKGLHIHSTTMTDEVRATGLAVERKLDIMMLSNIHRLSRLMLMR